MFKKKLRSKAGLIKLANKLCYFFLEISKYLIPHYFSKLKLILLILIISFCLDLLWTLIMQTTPLFQVNYVLVYTITPIAKCILVYHWYFVFYDVIYIRQNKLLPSLQTDLLVSFYLMNRMSNEVDI